MRANQPILNYDAGILDQRSAADQASADQTNFAEQDTSVTDIDARARRPARGMAQLLKQFAYDHPWIGLMWLPQQVARVICDGAGSFTVYVPDSAIAMQITCSGVAYMSVKGKAINTPANGTVEQATDNNAGSFLLPANAPGQIMYCGDALKQFDVAGAAGVVVTISFFAQDGQ